MLSSWLTDNYRNTALDDTPDVVADHPCRLFGFTLINPNTVPVYLKLM
jgi:hypothetical protein